MSTNKNVQNDFNFVVRRRSKAYLFILQNESVNISQQNIFNLNEIWQNWLNLLERFTTKNQTPFNNPNISIGKILGQGAFSKVYKIKYRVNSNIDLSDSRNTANTQETSYALKVIKKESYSEQQLRENLFNEIRLQRSLQCGNIIKINQVWEDEDQIYLFLDYVEGGTLRDYLNKGQRFTGFQARKIATQLLLSIDYMQGRGIIHRDLKPENILLRFDELNNGDPDAYLADFGFALELSEDLTFKDVYGTPGFVDPDIIAEKKYSFSSDIFSVGCIIYCLISRKHLFKGRTPKETINLNIKCDVLQKIEDLTCSRNCKNLLFLMLNKNQKYRPFAAECLKHSWFQDDVDAIEFSLNINRLDNLESRRGVTISPQTRKRGNTVAFLKQGGTTTLTQKFSNQSSSIRHSQFSPLNRQTDQTIIKKSSIEQNQENIIEDYIQNQAFIIKQRCMSQFRHQNFQKLSDFELNRDNTKNRGSVKQLKVQENLSCHSSNKTITFNQMMKDFTQVSRDIEQKSKLFQRDSSHQQNFLQLSMSPLHKKCISQKHNHNDDECMSQPDSFSNKQENKNQQQLKLFEQTLIKNSNPNSPVNRESLFKEQSIKKGIDISNCKQRTDETFNLPKQSNKMIKRTEFSKFKKAGQINQQIEQKQELEIQMAEIKEQQVIRSIEVEKIESIDLTDFEEISQNICQQDQNITISNISQYQRDSPTNYLDMRNIPRVQRIFVHQN